MRYKRDGDVARRRPTRSWPTIVQEIGLGLIDLGIQAGERVCILANTRPEWSYVDMAATSAGAVVVPIYQTNSPEECQWVISDSGACAVVVRERGAAGEDRRDPGPGAEPAHDHRDRPAGRRRRGNGSATVAPLDAITLEQVRERGRGRSPEELEARRAAVARRIRSPSSTPPGRPDRRRAASSPTATTGRSSTWSAKAGEIQGDEVIYLYLPLAHSYALLIQLAAFDLGGTLAYFGGDTKQIVPELLEVKPTYLPSVPRVFEKIYTLAHGAIEAKPPEERKRRAGDRARG